MSKLKPKRASRRLVQHRDDPEVPRTIGVNEAAKKMAARLVKKYGKNYMSEIAGRGGTASWAGTSHAERVIEMRRRAATRKKRRDKELAEAIKAGLEKYR